MKNKVITMIVSLVLIIPVGFVATGCSGGDISVLEGRWRLSHYQINDRSYDTFFTHITFDSLGNFTSTHTLNSGGTITGTARLTNNYRIRFNSDNPSLDSFFNLYAYRVRFVTLGHGMLWEWSFLGDTAQFYFALCTIHFQC